MVILAIYLPTISNSRLTFVPGTILWKFVLSHKYSTTKIVPGTTGIIPINIDCTNSKVALDYIIELNKESVPSNLKFYTDDTYTTEYTTINSFVGLNDNKVIDHNIYWKWEFTEDDETTEWSNKNIIVSVNVTASQRIAGDTA